MAVTRSRRQRRDGRVCEMKVRPERLGAWAVERQRWQAKVAREPCPPPQAGEGKSIYSPALAGEGRVGVQRSRMRTALGSKARLERQGSRMVQQPRLRAWAAPEQCPPAVQQPGTGATLPSPQRFSARPARSHLFSR